MTRSYKPSGIKLSSYSRNYRLTYQRQYDAIKENMDRKKKWQKVYNQTSRRKKYMRSYMKKYYDSHPEYREYLIRASAKRYRKKIKKRGI